MKIRMGFVSNSSSSSFIVHIKQSPKCEHCGRTDVNILDMLSEIGDYDETCIIGRDKIIDHYIDDYDQEDLNDITKKMDTITEPGIFAKICIDNCDMITENIIKKLPGVTIVDSDYE